MKRILCIMLALLLFISMSACRKQPAGSNDATVDANTTGASTGEPSAESTAEVTTASTETTGPEHVFDKWATKAQATCLQEGTQARKCTECGKAEIFRGRKHRCPPDVRRRRNFERNADGRRRALRDRIFKRKREAHHGQLCAVKKQVKHLYKEREAQKQCASLENGSYQAD